MQDMGLRGRWGYGKTSRWEKGKGPLNEATSPLQLQPESQPKD